MNTKTVYSTKAEKYARFRWDYAASAVETIIKMTQMSTDTTIADLGAGTGILTKHFVGKVQTIYAVEPNFEMRQILTREVKQFPSISVVDGCAEATTLPDTSVDVITVAQALHWFAPQPAKHEMLRILKKDGWLVLLRNYATSSEQDEVVRRLMTEEYGANFSVVTERPKERPPRFYFEHDNFETLVFPFVLQQSWEEFIGSLTTASFMPDEDHPLFPKLEAEAKKIFSQYSHHSCWQVEGETELIIGRPTKPTENAS